MDLDVLKIIEVVGVAGLGGLITTFYLARENKREIGEIKTWRQRKDEVDQNQEKELIRLKEKIDSVENLIAQKIDALQNSFESFARAMQAKIEKYDKEFEDLYKNKPWEK